MKVSAKSDRGLVRLNNEDTVRFGALSDSVSVYAVVCDGMGGESAGEVASAIAADSISKSLKNGFAPGMSADETSRLLRGALDDASVAVYEAAKEDPRRYGMGTTAVAAIITDDSCCVAWAGDSRAYLLRGGELTQMTRDHSYIQSLIDRGLYDPDSPSVARNKHMITKALGMAEPLDSESVSVDFGTGDMLLLCSDGLTNHVGDEGIASILTGEAFTDSVKALIDAAKADGGSDNVTVLIAAHNEDFDR